MLEISVPFWFLLILSGSITGLVIILALRTKLQQGSGAFAVLMSALTIWSFGYSAELLSKTLGQTIFFAKLQYIGIVLIPPAWLFFALCLNPWMKLKRARIFQLLLIVPVIVLVFVWTNDMHQLFWA